MICTHSENFGFHPKFGMFHRRVHVEFPVFFSLPNLSPWWSTPPKVSLGTSMEVLGMIWTHSENFGFHPKFGMFKRRVPVEFPGFFYLTLLIPMVDHTAKNVVGHL